MRRVVVIVALLGSISGVAFAAWSMRAASRRLPSQLPGWALYDRYCLACHGERGDGRGPAAPYTAGRPRDFTTGDFAWRSTPLGQPPTADDLRLAIRHGAPGTSMPAFALAPHELDQLVAIVQAFAPDAHALRSSPIRLAPPPPVDAARGAQLWLAKGCTACHGPTGNGETPAARTIVARPYDLTREPLHRPRADTDVRRAAALSIATGRKEMPGYHGTLPDADIWALADHVVAIHAGRPVDRRRLDERAIDLDRERRTITGTWPGAGDGAAIFGLPALPPQGAPPTALAPAQTSLSADQCARCHAKQHREWQTSLHHAAASPGLAAQMMGMALADTASCMRCHAPLAEQRTDPALRAQGVSCAGCHVRGWTRHGPPRVSPSLLASASYPLTTLALYERSDFCLPCHQLPPRTAVAGRPLLDTYREWLEGPYMPRGVQCQHCHMPNREHTFRGIHDRDTFRQAIALTARASRRDRVVSVVAELANVGAGHYLPTTPTPAAWLEIALLDGNRRPIAGATARLRIGRDISFDGAWHEHADTRIPPGERITLARGWSGGRTAEARAARITVTVHPDDYYERLYAQRLAGTLAPARRALYEQALAKAKAARYVAEQRELAIAP